LPAAIAALAIRGKKTDLRNSGVMTFTVNQDGVLYERDLGQDTGKLAAAMSEYNPDSSWRTAD